MKLFPLFIALAGLCGPALAQEFKMPGFKTQSTPAAVFDEHIDALNKCDLSRLMAQYPDDAVFILPDGVWMQGRDEILNLFLGFCKDRENGGLKGAEFHVEFTNVVGSTLNISWRLEAPFLVEPYRGADAYVTKDGLMQAQVTTFKVSDMNFKP
uniref:YybH family protein n=1 Tax=Marinobacterium profundum TaxID=1714300 RepID=UPI0008375003|nr:nuclear transport factor 2 family protein [Marinobacterium profundum]